MEFHERIIAVMDCPLPQTPKAVLLALARYANAAGEARPGMTTLARCASVSRESVRLAVQYLLDLDGVLTLYRTGQRQRRWVLHLERLPQTPPKWNPGALKRAAAEARRAANGSALSGERFGTGAPASGERFGTKALASGERFGTEAPDGVANGSARVANGSARVANGSALSAEPFAYNEEERGLGTRFRNEEAEARAGARDAPSSAAPSSAAPSSASTATRPRWISKDLDLEQIPDWVLDIWPDLQRATARPHQLNAEGVAVLEAAQAMGLELAEARGVYGDQLGAYLRWLDQERSCRWLKSRGGGGSILTPLRTKPTRKGLEPQFPRLFQLFLDHRLGEGPHPEATRHERPRKAGSLSIDELEALASEEAGTVLDVSFQEV